MTKLLATVPASANARILKRLLRRESVARLLAAQQACEPLAIVDRQGKLVYGMTDTLLNEQVNIRLNDEIIGTVFGAAAPRLAQMLELLAEQALEARELAADSLQKSKELKMLHAVSEKFFVASEVEQVGGLVREEAGRLVPCDTVAVLLLNDETQRLELIASEGSDFEGRSALDVESDLIGLVLRSGCGEIVNDMNGGDRSPAVNQLASAICTPLKARNRTFGVVLVGSHTHRDYTAGHLELLNSLTSQAASALELARLNKSLVSSAEKPAQVIYSVEDRPPLPVVAVLGLQHVLIAIMSLAYPVLVTLEAAGSRIEAASVVSMSLIAMGIATFIQVFARPPFGSRLLVSHLTSAIFLAPSLLAARAGGLGLVFGMTAFAGLAGLMFSQVIGRFRKIFPPEISGVVVLMVGLSMIRVALSQFVGLGEGDTQIEASELIIGLVTMGMIIALTVSSFIKLRLYATIIGLAVGFVLAIALGEVEPAQIARLEEQPLFGLPAPPDFALRFDVLLIIPFLAAALASAVKDAGMITSLQKAGDSNWRRPDTKSVSGGIAASAFGNVAAGLLGGTGIGISAGGVGLSIGTGALARVVGIAAGVLFVALAFMPKATAAFALLPPPVIGAGLIYVACYLVTSGTQLIVSRMLDSRRTFIIGLSIIGGVGVDLLPKAFAGAPAWAQAFLASPLAFSTTLAVGLNLLLSIGVSSTAALRLAPDQPLREPVARFMERNGAAWGARTEVMARAAPAVIEWCEEMRRSGICGGTYLKLRFDEFHLTVIVECAERGETSGTPPGAAILETFARHVQKRYGCKVTLNNGAAGSARMGFIH
ncbi:MAG: purine/pyrimidine permease [Rhizobiaceae bacterium]|nr:purine/pyrimidine permease [Rhizobiaceae bacterium]